MQKCYACHEETGDNLYCLHCGTLQKCLHCDHVFETDGKFCGKCGTQRGDKPAEEKKGNAPLTSQQESSVTTPPNAAAQATSSPNGKGSSNKKIIIGAVVLVLAAAAIYFFMFNNMQKTPEDTVKNFIKTVDKRDEKRLEEFFRPADQKEFLKRLSEDYSEFPNDAKWELLRIEDVNYESDNVAYVATEVRISSESENEAEEYYNEMEMLKLKNKWYIVGVY